MAEQPAPNVYACIAAVSAEIAQTGISKDRKNEQQHYKFRGIDDVWRVTTPGAFSNDGMPVAGVWVEAGEYTSVANLIPVRAVKANAHLIERLRLHRGRERRHRADRHQQGPQERAAALQVPRHR
jgi:hypothetical protein